MTDEWGKLKVWEKAHEFALAIYKSTRVFPKTENLALTNQMRRAAVSVPANIVEGQSRNTTREYLSFLCNARGSHAEVGYYLLLAKDLEYLSSTEYEVHSEAHREIGRMLKGLIKSLPSRS